MRVHPPDERQSSRSIASSQESQGDSCTASCAPRGAASDGRNDQAGSDAADSEFGPYLPVQIQAPDMPEAIMRTKAEMLSAVEGMLKEAFLAKAEGASQPRLARAYGYADGYLKALLDAGLATQKELLALVADVRTAIGGPATETRGEAGTEVAA